MSTHEGPPPRREGSADPLPFTGAAVSGQGLTSATPDRGWSAQDEPVPSWRLLLPLLLLVALGVAGLLVAWLT